MSSRKRQAPGVDDDPSESPDAPSSSRAHGSSPPLPPSSPPLPPFEEADEQLATDDIVDDLDEMAEEEDGEDLFGENMMRDYREAGEKDRYDVNDDHIDDEGDHEEIDLAERRKIDASLNRRDRAIQERMRGGAYLDDDDFDMSAGREAELPPLRRRHRNFYDDDIGMKSDDDSEVDPLSEILTLEALADIKTENIHEWVTQPAVNRSIAREFKNFLLEYTDSNGQSVYGSRIRTLGEVNSESLEVDFGHLTQAKAVLSFLLANSPADVLQIMDVVAMEVVQLHYPDYAQIHPEVHVRIVELDIMLKLRDLRESHINKLVKVAGVVTRRTGVFPQLKFVKFNCGKCGIVLGPFLQDSQQEIKVSYCHNCQSRGPFMLNSDKTIYRNYQKLTLQESPGSVPAGRLPRHREVILLWDLIDIAKPGEEVEITGIYKNAFDAVLNAKNGFPVFATVIEANSVLKRDAGKIGNWSFGDAEERKLRELSREPRIIERLIASVAPSIYGHDDCKTAIACSLFGGVAKDINGKHSIRGDINVLLLGDPGTAKSQLLKYSEKTAHRAVFTTGQGASAVGLTASVRKDPISKEWTLEGGALVLADRGTCLIDEFDKMNDQDRTSIHEAMEQQSISISKAGIVTTLHARAAIIAAANPNGGRYNPTIPFSQNVNLTEPILSRFDILCVVKDIVDPVKDELLASFVVSSHHSSHPRHGDLMDVVEEGDEADDSASSDAHTWGSSTLNNGATKTSSIPQQDLVPQDILRKYIHFARTQITPKLHNVDMDKVSRFYSDMRREALTTGSYPVNVRHLESILRISESFAKMRLSEFVSRADINRAIKVTVSSFVGAQKVSIRRSLQRSLMRYTV